MFAHHKKAEANVKSETTPSKLVASPNAKHQPAWTNALTSQPALTLQRMPLGPSPAEDPRVHKPGASKAVTCAPPSHCPKNFCEPYISESFAIAQRTKMLPILMAGIALAVDSSVVPFWHEYLLGGSSPKNLTGTFAKEFTNSPTTAKTTEFLRKELEKSLIATPPTFIGGGSMATVDIGSRISSAITEIGTSGSANEMNFDIPKDIPGNLAGGIGADQTSCSAGAQPSPFNDERTASGLGFITKTSSGDLQVEPIIKYVVKDTIDLCPGDCGTDTEQIATVPMSQFEATGISGDVPFTVEFPAPPAPFVIPASSTP